MCIRDREYSLTDWISMQTMRCHAITEALTNDRQFEQKRFRALFRGDSSPAGLTAIPNAHAHTAGSARLRNRHPRICLLYTSTGRQCLHTRNVNPIAIEIRPRSFFGGE